MLARSQLFLPTLASHLLSTTQIEVVLSDTPSPTKRGNSASLLCGPESVPAQDLHPSGKLHSVQATSKRNKRKFFNGMPWLGARIRTWEWRNQNPPVPPYIYISKIILKNWQNSAAFQSMS
jgi:hypothetical protein